MKSISSLVLALSAPAAMAFAPSTTSTRQSTAVQNSLRDMAAYPDEMKMMGEFEQFDRNGAFSRSPQGGMQGGMQGDMQGGMNGGSNMRGMNGGRDMSGMHRMRDGFDPYSAYGNSYGMSQSDHRHGGPPSQPPRGMMMDFEMGPEMMMGGGGMNGVRDTNTMGGFEYDSRSTRRGGGGMGGPPGMMGGPEFFDQGMGMGGGMGFDGPNPMMGMGGPGMDYGHGYDGQFGGEDMRGDGQFGGGDMRGDDIMSRLGP